MKQNLTICGRDVIIVGDARANVVSLYSGPLNAWLTQEEARELGTALINAANEVTKPCSNEESLNVISG